MQCFSYTIIKAGTVVAKLKYTSSRGTKLDWLTFEVVYER